MATIGFLHTAEVHVDSFDALVRSRSSDVAVHVVLPELLNRARAVGATPELTFDLQAALTDLVTRGGADVVVCTCSTLGPIAEQVELPVPVLRVDRPMAAAAVRAGSRVGVIAALESTLSPTMRLLVDEATTAGMSLEIIETCLPEAWIAFEAGDMSDYLAQIADAAASIAPSVDVIVLAQASMAGAIPMLDALQVPVLASPTLAVEAAIALGTAALRGR